MAPFMAGFERTAYFQWMKREGLPIVEGYGVEDVRELELAPWPRLGGKGAFIQLYGMEGVTGMYVAEIPPGAALKPERHFYEEVCCILSGQGATEIWQEGGRKQIFEWGPWSLFSPPLNSWHRLLNGGREPVKILAVTNAPLMMDLLHNTDFIFNCSYEFLDRYHGEEDYFKIGAKRYQHGLQHVWESNFFPNIKEVGIDNQELKGAGVKITQFELSGNGLIGHLAEWPVGRYHKAHYHGPGAVLLIQRSHGYVLLWPKEIGARPYEGGLGDQVVKFEWCEGSVYCPPGGWFHQHFNVGSDIARQLAVRYGSRLYPVGFKLAAKRQEDGVYMDIKKGGTLIEYEDEDPEIRRGYEAALKREGVAMQMPGVSQKRREAV